MNDKPLTHNELKQFTGDLERYHYPLNHSVTYTPGVKHLAERAGAFWLIDMIVSYVGSPIMRQAIDKDPRLGSLQFWRLIVGEDRTAIVTCKADSGIKPAITQEIEYTNFPLDNIDLWMGYDGIRWTLYLPSEH